VTTPWLGRADELLAIGQKWHFSGKNVTIGVGWGRYQNAINKAGPSPVSIRGITPRGGDSLQQPNLTHTALQISSP
jgi:hypothetical protein